MWWDHVSMYSSTGVCCIAQCVGRGIIAEGSFGQRVEDFCKPSLEFVRAVEMEKALCWTTCLQTHVDNINAELQGSDVVTK